MENINPNWVDKIMLFPGVWVYKNVFKKELNIIKRVENYLNENSSKDVWKEAAVGYNQKMPEYRDCQDFKIGEIKNPRNADQMILGKIWQDLYNVQLPPVEDYCSRYNIKMEYWEVMNFIKYGAKQHFQEH